MLFGRHLPDSHVREYLSLAIEAAPPDSSVTCFFASHPGEFMPAGPENAALHVLTKVTDPAVPPAGPMAFDVVRHERHLPHIKHVGEVSKTLYLRRANARGFDDAAFEDSAGRLSEATIWNLAFWDGESVIWPEADALSGVTMQILVRQLEARGIPQQTRPVRRSDLTENMSAVAMNSWTPGIALTLLGEHRLNNDPTFARLLHDVYAAEPLVRI
jgi:branched-subunit amino acid aminotransferase/4-amino-4-deoxychorismate lyase